MFGKSDSGTPVDRRLPPLNALRAFTVAARAGSFTLAAQELQVSQGAVSRQVAHLEEFLGLKLFERHHREVKLTREGAEYAMAMAAAFDQVVQGTQRLWRSQRNRSLRLKIFPTLAIRWLVPRLGGFHVLHPDIDVQITTSMQAARLDREEIDLTVVSQLSPMQGLQFDPLFDVELLPVCSRRLLDRLPPIHRPEDLIGQVLLHVVTRPDDWARWFKGLGITAPIALGGLGFGDSALVYQAASNSAGFAMAQSRFVEDDLATGRLVSPCPQRIPTGETYYLVTLAESASSPAIVAFRDWILTEARKSAAAQAEGQQPARAAR
jgi:LysR family glycine cleavage system transcriptional activator